MHNEFTSNRLLFRLSDKDVSKLQRIQNSAARLVSMSKKCNHITPILKELHWLPVKSRIQYKVILLTFRATHGLAPIYLSELIAPYIPTRSLRSASQVLLVVNRGRTKTFGDRSFTCAAPILWNSLPSTLRVQSNIDLFRKHLKTYLFDNSYWYWYWFWNFIFSVLGFYVKRIDISFSNEMRYIRYNYYYYY